MSGVHTDRLGLMIVSTRASCVQKGGGCEQPKRETCSWGVRSEGDLGRGLTVIGSSDKVHVVDALAITGEEGRGSLRKAAGSWQTSIDPQMSEWGNPARKGHCLLNI